VEGTIPVGNVLLEALVEVETTRLDDIGLDDIGDDTTEEAGTVLEMALLNDATNEEESIAVDEEALCCTVDEAAIVDVADVEKELEVLCSLEDVDNELSIATELEPPELRVMKSETVEVAVVVVVCWLEEVGTGMLERVKVCNVGELLLAPTFAVNTELDDDSTHTRLLLPEGDDPAD
jgi:hypothetical protein